MSDPLIASLNQRISELQAEKDNLNKALGESRVKLKQYKQERDSAKAELSELMDKADGEFSAFDDEKGELSRQVEEWKQKATAAPTEQAQRIAELESTLRTRDHRDSFREKVGAELADGITVEDLWHFGGFDAKAAESLAPEQIDELVGKVRAAKPALFREANPGGGPGHQAAAPRERPPLKVDISPGRGARDHSAGGVRYTLEEVRKPGWMSTPRGKEIVKARQDGTAVLAED